MMTSGLSETEASYTKLEILCCGREAAGMFIPSNVSGLIWHG